MYRYKKSTGKLKRFFMLVLLMILVSIMSILLYRMYEGIEVYSGEGESYKTQLMAQQTEIIEETSEPEITQKIEEVTKSVVGISKIKNMGTSIFLNDSANQLGLGTGVIVSDNGYILTNEHVSGGKYSNCYVTLENGKNYNASVVWSDPDIDLSIIKINANGLNFAKLGDSDTIKIAEKVYAIGNPIGFEFQRTVTSGIVSALDRTIKIEEEKRTSYMEDLIQTDATINPGNSGGPLINTNGEVIGINTVKITSAEGIGFAVPINIVKTVIESCINTGGFEEANLGIFAYDKEAVRYLNSTLELDTGIYVAQISKDGPCSKLNLKEGDIITKIDEVNLEKMSKLREYIYTKKPDDEVRLSVIRNKKEFEVVVKLGKKS